MDIDKLLLISVVNSPFPMAMGTRMCCIKGKQMILWHLYLNWFPLTHCRFSRATSKANLLNTTLITLKQIQEAAACWTSVGTSGSTECQVSVLHGLTERLFQPLYSKVRTQSFNSENGSSSAACKALVLITWSCLSDFRNAHLPSIEDPH